MKSMLATDFKQTPYWWERTPRPAMHSELPSDADVVIVGSGYTGLSAAIQTAKAGRDTVVIDAEAAGWGCSSRNGGQVSTSLKPTFGELSKQYGGQVALEMLREGNYALAWVESFIKQNNIDCDWQKNGRFHGAHTPAAYAKLQAKIAAIPAELNIGAYCIERDQQHNEIDSDFYHGGAIYPNNASLDPGRYHHSLLQCAKAAGTRVVANVKVQNIRKLPGKTWRPMFQIQTNNGVIRAADVVIATSGYSGELSVWHRRRIIPVGSYVIATERLPLELLNSLIPNHRTVIDTRRMVFYYRVCPQRQRILFGGRVALQNIDLRASASKLHAEMAQIFPQLARIKISHSWMGYVGFSFDQLPHIGKHNGIHYAMGYCGSGISLSSYFGMKTGLKVIGDPAGDTAIDRAEFRGRWYYRNHPWFLSPAIFCYRWLDQRK